MTGPSANSPRHVSKCLHTAPTQQHPASPQAAHATREQGSALPTSFSGPKLLLMPDTAKGVRPPITP